MTTPTGDSAYAWVIAVVSFFGCAVVDGLCNSYGLLYEGLDKRFPDAGRSRVVLAGSLMSGCFMLFGPLSSEFVRRFGNRCCMIFGALVTTISIVIAARWTSSIGWFTFFYGVMAGFGLSFIFIPSMIAVTEYFAEKRRALAVGVACAGGGAGVLMVAPLASWLLQNFSWTDAVTLLSGVALTCVFLGTLMKPVKPTTRGLPVEQILVTCDSSGEQTSKQYSQSDLQTNVVKQPEENALIASSNLSPARLESESTGRSISVMKQDRVKNTHATTHATTPATTHAAKTNGWVMSDHSLLVLCLSSTAVQMAYYVPIMFMADYTRSLDKHVTTDQIADLFVVFGISNTIGRLLGGLLSNQKRVDLMHLYCWSLVISGVFTGAVVNLASHVVHVSWYFSFLGLSTAIFVPTSTCLLIEYLSLEKLSSAFGWLSVIRGASSMCGAPIAGVIRDSTSNYSASFYFSAAMFIVGGVTIYLLPASRRSMERRRRHRRGVYEPTTTTATSTAPTAAPTTTIAPIATTIMALEESYQD